MTAQTSKYVVYMLHRLWPGIFGEAYVIVTGTELSPGEYRAEHFILTQRPNEAFRMGAFDVVGDSFPAELGLIDTEFAIAEAYRQAEIDLQWMLEERATELGRPDLAYISFELIQRPNSFVSCWIRGRFHKELMSIQENTKCPSLARYLSYLQQIHVTRRGG